jgi:hypothetical protein
MRRRFVILAGLVAAASAAIGGLLATGAVGGDAPQPTSAAPRVCWKNDYDSEPPRLANMCEYRTDEERWYLEVDGEPKPADQVAMPIANLCIYFWGPRCPTPEEKRSGSSYPGTSGSERRSTQP